MSLFVVEFVVSSSREKRVRKEENAPRSDRNVRRVLDKDVCCEGSVGLSEVDVDGWFPPFSSVSSSE
jgi:hypothetical protein